MNSKPPNQNLQKAKVIIFINNLPSFLKYFYIIVTQKSYEGTSLFRNLLGFSALEASVKILVSHSGTLTGMTIIWPPLSPLWSVEKQVQFPIAKGYVTRKHSAHFPLGPSGPPALTLSLCLQDQAYLSPAGGVLVPVICVNIYFCSTKFERKMHI